MRKFARDSRPPLLRYLLLLSDSSPLVSRARGSCGGQGAQRAAQERPRGRPAPPARGGARAAFVVRGVQNPVFDVMFARVSGPVNVSKMLTTLLLNRCKC